MLWGGVDLDLTVAAIRKQPCSVCGKPASVAVRRLDEQERVFVCAGHEGQVARPSQL